MTKVYLVFARKCKANGRICIDSEEYFTEYFTQVFTNRRLANKYADYMNKDWREGFERNADFEKEKILFYFVVTKVICRTDYSKTPF